MPETIEAEPIPSVKDLASSEASVRRSCLKTITTHLAARSPSSPLSASQCLQLWRGLYVALYMHDSKNAISVQKLIADLAATVRTMASKDAELRASDDIPPVWLATWTTAFWETICREWASIDQWRMNKVLLLVRFFLRESFNITLTSVVTDNPGSETVSKDLTADQIQILETWPLSPRERKVPDGLRLHILDIWVDELTGQISSVEDQSVQSVEGDPETVKAALLQAAKAFMAPVERVSKEALGKPVKMRAKDALQSFQEAFPS